MLMIPCRLIGRLLLRSFMAGVSPILPQTQWLLTNIAYTTSVLGGWCQPSHHSFDPFRYLLLLHFCLRIPSQIEVLARRRQASHSIIMHEWLGPSVKSHGDARGAGVCHGLLRKEDFPVSYWIQDISFFTSQI